MKISSEQQRVDREKFDAGYELCFGDEKKSSGCAPIADEAYRYKGPYDPVHDAPKFLLFPAEVGDAYTVTAEGRFAGHAVAVGDLIHFEEVPGGERQWAIARMAPLVDEDVCMSEGDARNVAATIHLERIFHSQDPRYSVARDTEIDWERVMTIQNTEQGWRFTLKSLGVGFAIGLLFSGLVGVGILWIF